MKDDRSLKQGWDEKILGLCDKLNESNDYYTTSSCSGRILILIDSKEKRDDLFLKVWHETISLNDLRGELDKIKLKKLVYFKQDPCILHIACRDLERAQQLIDLAILAGWKRSGIITTKKRFIVELNATDRIEFPVINEGKLLVNDEFLGVVVDEANKKIKESWEKIARIEKSLLSS
jgi:tRNA wybutosine-synthesizing protein 3